MTKASCKVSKEPKSVTKSVTNEVTSNEKELMKRTKQELVSFIIRKDNVEKKLTDKFNACEEQLKVANNSIDSATKVIETLTEKNRNCEKLVNDLSKDIASYQEQIDGYALDVINYNKTINKYRIIALILGIIAIVEAIIILI